MIGVTAKVMIRHKILNNGRKVKLCAGKDNACAKEAKSNGLCTGCKTGFDRTMFINRNEDDIFTDSRGVRYKFIGGQSRKLCIGDENTCKSYRDDSTGLCVGHRTGFKKYGTKGLVKGDIIERNGKRKVFDGVHIHNICSEPNCNIVAVKSGKCKKHSPHWKCKFADEPCRSIRVDDNYCTNHRGGVCNPQVKSHGERLIAIYLDSLGISYQCNKCISFQNKILYPDFHIVDFGVVIEFDGKQHFEPVKYWGDIDGFNRRSQCDELKDEWAIFENIYLLRLSFADKYKVNDLIRNFFTLLPDMSDNFIFASGFNGYDGREYQRIYA